MPPGWRRTPSPSTEGPGIILRSVSDAASDQAPPPPQPPQNPFAELGKQLGLGPNWSPMVPVNWQFAKVQINGQDLHVLVLSTPMGLLGIGFAPDAVKNFTDQFRAQVSGLTLAGGIPGVPLGPFAPIRRSPS